MSSITVSSEHLGVIQPQHISKQLARRAFAIVDREGLWFMLESSMVAWFPGKINVPEGSEIYFGSSSLINLFSERTLVGKLTLEIQGTKAIASYSPGVVGTVHGVTKPSNDYSSMYHSYLASTLPKLDYKDLTPLLPTALRLASKLLSDRVSLTTSQYIFLDHQGFECSDGIVYLSYKSQWPLGNIAIASDRVGAIFSGDLMKVALVSLDSQLVNKLSLDYRDLFVITNESRSLYVVCPIAGDSASAWRMGLSHYVNEGESEPSKPIIGKPDFRSKLDYVTKEPQYSFCHSSSFLGAIKYLVLGNPKRTGNRIFMYKTDKGQTGLSALLTDAVFSTELDVSFPIPSPNNKHVVVSINDYAIKNIAAVRGHISIATIRSPGALWGADNAVGILEGELTPGAGDKVTLICILGEVSYVDDLTQVLKPDSSGNADIADPGYNRDGDNGDDDDDTEVGSEDDDYLDDEDESDDDLD